MTDLSTWSTHGCFSKEEWMEFKRVRRGPNSSNLSFVAYVAILVFIWSPMNIGNCWLDKCLTKWVALILWRSNNRYRYFASTPMKRASSIFKNSLVYSKKTIHKQIYSILKLHEINHMVFPLHKNIRLSNEQQWCEVLLHQHIINDSKCLKKRE